MLINEYVLHHANCLLYFTGAKCNLYHFCAAHQKEVGRAMTHCTENALFPIEENQICTLFVHFFLHLHLFDKAVSSDGKWVDKSRQKQRHGPSVGGKAVSLSINDIICPPDVSLPVTSMALELEKKKTKRKTKRNIYFSH